MQAARVVVACVAQEDVRAYCEIRGLLAKIVQNPMQEEGGCLELTRFLVDDCGVLVDGDDRLEWVALRNAAGDKGSSALSWCAMPEVMGMRSSVVRFLCEQGSDPMKPNHIGTCACSCNTYHISYDNSNITYHRRCHTYFHGMHQWRR
jgi:hypothetical protein